MNKRTRYGAYSAFLVMAMLLLVVLVNLAAEKMDLSWDLTDEELFTLSTETIEVLDNLNREVKLYVVQRTGEKNVIVDEVIAEYEKNSKKIKVEYIDPYLFPHVIQGFKTGDEDISDGSIIAECDNRSKVVDGSGLVENHTQFNGQVYSIESKVTGAIDFVLGTEIPKVYIMTGHGEVGVGEKMTEKIELSNYEVAELNLLNGDIPDDCDILLLTTPGRDYTDEEAEKVIGYLDDFGRGLVSIDLVNEKLPNYESIIEKYGLENTNSLVVEVDKANYIADMQTNIVPSYYEHDITLQLIEGQYLTLLPAASGIGIKELQRSSLENEVLMLSTQGSYAKKDLSLETLGFEEGDMKGPIPLAVAVTDVHTMNDTGLTKMLAFASSSIYSDNVDDYIGGGNSTVVVGALNWLNDAKGKAVIGTKFRQEDTLILNASSSVFLMAYSLVLVPLAIMATGLVIIFIRRRR